MGELRKSTRRVNFLSSPISHFYIKSYSTVTDLARLRGWSTLQPRITAMW